MTKIFATTQPDSVEKSPHDQKPAKTEGEVYSVIKPTILPISLPNTTIVKKDRKCHFSWIIGLILMLWVLATTVIIFHLAPDCVYRKLHQLTHHSEPHVTMAERFVFDIAEPHIKIAPKLPQISESSNVIDSSASESLNKMMNIDGNKGEQQLMSRAIVDGDVSEPLRKLEAVDGSANEAFRNQAIIDGDVSEPFGIQAIVDGDVGESFKNHASIDGDASEPFKQQVIIDGEANEPFRQQLIVEGETSEPFRNDVIVDGTVEETSKQEVPAEESTGEQRSGNDTIPDDDDATNAIRTLLRRPDVQQVVIVGRSEDSQGERPVKGVIVIDGSAIREGGANPSDVVNHIQNNRGVVIPAEQLMGDSEQPINPVQLAVQPPETLDAIKEQNMALNRPVAPPQMSPAASPDYQQQMIK
ncbi:hypothetical protein Tcan_06856 [Toxocara canis]|uniref:Uncharacterized protein n=1 Tax=Toxocara canis TaxID=6265 RepID=A0A0B2VPA4_TOXCA|nr:hypothetical protein Tcan_06856 [Toxocara canis]